MKLRASEIPTAGNPRATPFRWRGREMVAITFDPVPRRLADLLGEAEQEVLAATLAGRTNAEIATARGTSVHTVNNQLARIYEKLRLSASAPAGENPHGSRS